METISYKANSVIFSKGDQADCLYFINKGAVAIVADHDGNETELAQLKKGDFFGEMGVIEGEPRSATARAVNDVELLKVTAKDFPTFVQQNPSEAETIVKGLSKALRSTSSQLADAQKAVAELTEISPKKDGIWSKLRSIAASYRDRLAESKTSVAEANKTKFGKGEYIFHKGEKSDRLYRILTGEVGLYSSYEPDADNLIAVCKPGDIFGEMGVVEDERRNATAVSLVDKTELYAMANTNLTEFIALYPEDALRILRNLSRSLRSTTDKYIETLCIVDELIRADRSNYLSYPEWDRLIQYSDMYRDYQAHTFNNPMLYTSFFGQW
ncbi:MAG: cyclic nucleotide-binding domain-containing protein [Clostridia bacterium]|nr:cyclic nucleotide-binding domain-containing protein [Clostridia bacterium]